MKTIFISLVLVMTAGSIAQAKPPVQTCENGWPALAVCGVDLDVAQVNVCLDPNKNDGSGIVNTLHVRTGQWSVEAAILESMTNREMKIATSGSKYTGLIIRIISGRLAGGERTYQAGARPAKSDLNGYMCSVHPELLPK